MTETEVAPAADQDGAGTATRADGAPGIAAVLGAVAAMMGLITSLAPLSDNSFLTHLATGRLILDTGSVPTADPYSFTAAGEPWVVQSWFASVLYAGVEDLVGLDGVRVLQGLLGAGIGLAVWALTGRSPSLVVRVAVTTVVMFVAGEYLAGRPLMFGVLGLLLVLLAADGKIDPRWLVPVGWVWVNTHGSFPYAIALLGLLAVGRRLDEGAWGPEVRIGAWAAAGIALGALNPMGPRLLLFPALLLRRTEAFRSIVEWRPPDYGSWSHFVVAVLLATAVLLLVRRFSWRLALPLAAFGVLGLTAQRNQLVLLLVLAPTLAALLPAVGPAVDDVRRAIFRPALVLVGCVAVVASVVSLGEPAVNLDAYPEDASVWVDEQGLWGPDSRVVAPDYVGNLREAQAGADARVFFDDRVDMYPIELVRDYQVLLDASDGWQDVLADHGATAVLWEEDTPLGEAIAADAGWRIVHRDAPWVVLVPTSAP